MSKLKDLIEELCPNGVEYKALEEVVEILDNKREPITKSAREAGPYPYYGANGVQDYVADYIFDGTFVLVGEDGSVQTKNGNPVVNWANGKIWVNNHAHIASEKKGTLLRFVFHYLQTVNVAPLIHGNIPKLTGKDFRAISIPIPPIEVQEEIVRILDHYTDLAAELQAELQARQEQYEYYRNKLLSFNKIGGGTQSVIWKKMNEISHIYSGKNKDKKEDGIYPVYGSTGIIAYSDEYSYDKTQILIARVGANAGYTHLAKGQYDVSDNALVVDLIEDCNLKYIYYILVNMKLNQYAKGGGQPLITARDLNKLLIPIVSNVDQDRIVSTLDKFELLVNDLSQGLPAEIAAVQEQYEYYRNKLLTFNRISA